MADQNLRLCQAPGKRVAMLIALPSGLWNLIRAEARDLGVGPSKIIEPVLRQAFNYRRADDDDSVTPSKPQ